MPVRCAVLVPAVLVGPNVLDERPSHRDVKKLVTTADAEDGQVTLQCLSQQCEFVSVAPTVWPVGQRASLLAVEAGIDVDTASEEQATRVSGKLCVFDDQVFGAAGVEGVVVELRPLPGGRSPVGDGNQRRFSHLRG